MNILSSKDCGSIQQKKNMRYVTDVSACFVGTTRQSAKLHSFHK